MRRVVRFDTSIGGFDRYIIRDYYLLVILSSMFPSGLRNDADLAKSKKWSSSYAKTVYVDLPTGQCAYPIFESHLYLFDHLPEYTKPYDQTNDDVMMFRIENVLDDIQKRLGSCK